MFEELEMEFKHLNYSYTQKREVNWQLRKIKNENKKALLTTFAITNKLPFGKISDVQWWYVKKPDE